MRTRFGCVASLVLASLSCKARPTEPFPEHLSCPTAHELQPDESPPPPGCAFFDTDHDKGRADLKVCVQVGPPIRTEVTTAGSTFRVAYDGIVPTSWDRRGNPAPSALEVAPPELSRVIPSLQQPVEPRCLAEPQVSAYLGELRDRAQGRWLPPPLDPTAERTVVVLLSLSASGEITGACFEPSVPDSVGASAVRALQRAAPFDPLIPEPESVYETKTQSGNKVETKTEKLNPGESRTACLAGRRLIASFTAR